MIVEITSLAPVVAFRYPAMPAQNAPATDASTTASRMCSSAGIPSKEDPTHTATTVPAMYWPWPPMLNRPARKAKATARPTRISGVVSSRVCWRFSAASVRSSAEIHGKNQFSPLPLKIAS
jgi:hypothetical protein